MRPDYTPESLSRYWDTVERSGPDQCWLWKLRGGRYGHGVFRYTVEGKRYWVPAHRVAWELLRGPIPDGLWVLHNCPGGDNPRCVNPAHLFLGTLQDNVADMVAKDRQAKGANNGRHTHPEATARGDRNGKTTVSDAQVREIFRRANAGERCIALAREFGIPATRVSLIKTRKIRSFAINSMGE